MLVVETIARVRREHAKGKSARQIAQGLGISRDTVTKYLKSGVTEVRYERQKQSFPQLGPYLLRLGRLPEAIARYEAALQLTPADPILHYNYANALFQAGRRAEAVAQCEMALRLKPGFPEARQVLERLRGIQ